ncbi:hypothetical protein L1049_002280 [Liquidambar formosana]|uniref:Vacuolar protein 14 C-terminal Fig4-binding domain-containing protein n=1 Tax=Liquidambar formosana TaxID=63359 RepID=A0AAP0NJ74_LIQFO
MASLSFIPSSVLRNLSDKLPEKRTSAAYEIRDIVKQLNASSDHDRIRALINMLITEFLNWPELNRREGGLIGLSATMNGLLRDDGLDTVAARHLEQIVPPVLNAFTDQDSRVRYRACEALYNIAKLSADSDANVQSAAKLLDRALMDIVTDSSQFSIEEFIPLLIERMRVINPFVRQFLLCWIKVINGSPEIDMLSYLPDFLDGLLNMLSDSNHEVQHEAALRLSDFLQEADSSPSVDYVRVAKILVHKATSPDEFTRLTVITWINKFVKVGGENLVPHYADILGVILPCISDKDERIRKVAHQTNEELHAFRPSPAEGLDIGAILSVAKRQLSSEREATQIQALHWIANLLARNRAEVLSFLDSIFDALLSTLSDPSTEVVLLVLEVHACIARDPHHFHHLVVSLLHNFQIKNSLLEKRGSLIICRLSVLLDAEKVYQEFATVLGAEVDLDFAYNMVQALNLILLTSSELCGLRVLLKQSLVNDAGKDLFVSLYGTWCHSPVAAISLCLLSQAYQHATCLIHLLGEEDFNLKFMLQLGKLILLLETPTFVHLRLQILEPRTFIWLVKALYGLLMLLPQQSEAFKILWTRLKTIPSNFFHEGQSEHYLLWNQGSQVSHHRPSGSQISERNEKIHDMGKLHSGIDFSALMQLFEQKQQPPSHAFEISVVFSHFHFIHLITGGDPEYPRAAYNYCGKDYGARGKIDGTSNMWAHLKSQCTKYPYRVVDPKQQTLCFVKKEVGEGKEHDGAGSGALKVVNYSDKAYRNALAKMIFVDELPFRHVEKEGFRSFCAVLEPRFTLPCRTTVARDCMKLFYERKGKLKKALKKQRVCPTTDTWTSIQNLNYMCLTAHWIDADWNLQKRILNICLVLNHKGETIGKHVEKCLLEWGIDKIFTITVDNASSNDGAIRYLKRKTKDWNSTILEHEFIHMRCCAHIVNLIVCEGLKDQNESIAKIRNAVWYVRSSPSRFQTFKNCVEHEKIPSKILVCLDVPIRWNSTYMMLEVAEKFEKAFERLEKDDPRYLSFFKEDEDEDEDKDENKGGKGRGRAKGRKRIGPLTMDDWANVRVFV